jgi:4'-phosphopantetheinyl transferase
MPTPTGITVWTVAVEEVPEEMWPRIAAFLDDDERTRAARFVFDRHRREYMAAHALTRLTLSAVADEPPLSWRFETAPGGKPRISRQPAPWFNLSHCDGRVACAVSPDIELGIDVEAVKQEAPVELARYYFARDEERWLANLSGWEQPLGFFRLWTLKEAFIKATGRGLAQKLQDFAFSFDPLRVAFSDPALGDASAWHFEQRFIGAEHLLALGWRAAAGEVSVAITEVRLEALIS